MCQHRDVPGSPIPVLDRSKAGSLRALRTDPIGLLESAARLGDVVRVPMPRVEVYVVNHPDAGVGRHRDRQPRLPQEPGAPGTCGVSSARAC